MKSNWKRHKKLWILVIVILLLGLLIYRSGQPSYNNYERRYGQLNIPADWQLIYEKLEKGDNGLGCWSASETTSCPAITRIYRIEPEPKMDQEKQNFLKLIEGTGFELFEAVYNGCKENKVKNDGYNCEFNARKNHSYLTANIYLSENKTKKTYSLELD